MRSMPETTTAAPLATRDSGVGLGDGTVTPQGVRFVEWDAGSRLMDATARWSGFSTVLVERSVHVA